MTERYTKLLRLSLIFVVTVAGYPSVAQNLIVNGSMYSSMKRSDLVAQGWYKYPNQPDYLNTPDINDDSGIAHIDPGWHWCCGVPTASPDGGTWQNVWDHENFAQTVYGLTIGTKYYFRFYYTSQGISTGSDEIGVYRPYPPAVTILGATGFSIPSGSILFQWSTYSGTLVATSDSIVIICSEGLYDGYIAYDGFYLGTVKPDHFLEVTAPESVTLCSGAGTATFMVQSDSATSYQWQTRGPDTWYNLNNGSGVSGSHSNTLLISNITDSMNRTEYRCEITSSCCNAVSAEAFLYVAPLPKPVMKINTEVPDICGNASIIISTDSFYHDYLWNDNSRNQSLQVSKPGTYWVEVTDSNNCRGRDSIQIYPCEKFVAPNAFTPNGDGKNDVFKPAFYGPVANYTLAIYNRWGKMIFISRDPGKGWDGTVSGVPQPDDAYVWDCRFQFVGNKPDHKSGTVVLVR